MNTKELRKAANCVYLVVEDDSVANHLSVQLAEAANYIDDMKELMHKLGATYYYGDFVAESPNEIDIERLLKKHGYRYTSEDQLKANSTA
ncbi:hypothetical protein [Endozoicomonas lisbonensis]|uniref:Phage protein n=1 Tax=Endozoicomonas lisbonensis TaxID=3120522 RepID=A0ABV2SPB1_9GAMM